MKKIYTLTLIFVALFSLLGCSIDVSQSPAGTSAPSVENTQPSASSNSFSGKLIYSTASNEGDVFTSKIQALDPTTKDQTNIFTVSGTAWIYYLTVSSVNGQVMMAYAPSSDDATSLYSLPIDGSEAPKFFVESPSTHDRYIQVEWSPDGKYIYYVYYNFADRAENEVYPHYSVFRMEYPNGQPEKILDQATWLRVSPDSSKIVYVYFDAVTGENKLYWANANGSNATQIPIKGALAGQIIDAPMFLPDGQTIIFSAASQAESIQPGWLDRLMGVQIAYAHNVPSDWWSLPLTGGEPARLTQLQTVKLFASLSPDNQYIASVSGDGIFAMNLDGSNIIRLLPDSSISSTVNWIP